MSTIDRFMGKLTGQVEPESDPPESNSDPVVPAVPVVVEPPASTVSPSIEPAVRSSSPVHQAAARPVEPGMASRVGDNPRAADPNRIVTMDLPRMAARGFLTPDAGVTQTSEEYQFIKRRLLANMSDASLVFDAPSNLIMVTSSLPGEGKTYTSVNLALSIAMEMDRTVLAVDTDVIKQDMTRIMNASGRPGLFDYLSRDDVSLPQVIFPTNIPKLSVIPAGTIRSTITERLASDAMRRLTLELSQRYADRIILFDSPPVLATTGATALAPYIGQIVLVVEAGRTSTDDLRHALQLMDHVRLAGLVLNKIKDNHGDGAQVYSYQYGYSRGD